jgi:hypothetical protein
MLELKVTTAKPATLEFLRVVAAANFCEVWVGKGDIAMGSKQGGYSKVGSCSSWYGFINT